MNMKAYQEMETEELVALQQELEQAFEDVKGKGLKLDMSRGKPAVTQLNMSMDMFDVLNSESDMKCEDGTDVRNYGVLDGIPEAKKLMVILYAFCQNFLVQGIERSGLTAE